MQKLRSTLAVFLFSCTLAACATNPTGNMENTPQAVAKRYTEAIYAGDADAVLKLIDFSTVIKKDKPGAEDILRGKMKVMVDKGHKEAMKKGGVASITTTEPEYSNEKKRATVKVTTQFKNGTQRTGWVPLTWVNNRWLMGGKD